MTTAPYVHAGPSDGTSTVTAAGCGSRRRHPVSAPRRTPSASLSRWISTSPAHRGSAIPADVTWEWATELPGGGLARKGVSARPSGRPGRAQAFGVPIRRISRPSDAAIVSADGRWV